MSTYSTYKKKCLFVCWTDLDGTFTGRLMMIKEVPQVTSIESTVYPTELTAVVVVPLQ